MSDTVYEKGGISFTRYWQGKEDGVQITFGGIYHQMSYREFRKAVNALAKSVRETKNAWWHGLDSATPPNSVSCARTREEGSDE